MIEGLGFMFIKVFCFIYNDFYWVDVYLFFSIDGIFLKRMGRFVNDVLRYDY